MSNYYLVRLNHTDLRTTTIFSTKIGHEVGHAEICLKTIFRKGAKGWGDAFLHRKRRDLVYLKKVAKKTDNDHNPLSYILYMHFHVVICYYM